GRGRAPAGLSITVPARFELLADVRPEFSDAALMEAAEREESARLDDDAGRAHVVGIERALREFEQRGPAEPVLLARDRAAVASEPDADVEVAAAALRLGRV